MTVNLRNTSGAPLSLGVQGRFVDADEVIHVEGDLAPKSAQVEDAYVVDTGAGLVAYPKSIWTAAGGPATAKPDVPAPDKEA